MKLVKQYFLIGLIAAFFCAVPSKTVFAAFSFTPDEQEWATWPEYCRARYSALTQIRNTQYNGQISPETIIYWRDTIGKSLFVHIHHACVGQIHHRRAMTAPSGPKRDREFKKAISGHLYTLQNGSNHNEWYAHLSASLAQVYRSLGEYDAAVKRVKPMTAQYPEFEEPYLVWALVLRDQGQFEEAVEVLERGASATNGGSAQLHYFLGLTYINLDQNDLALEHARLAYDLGYPLPGLKKKLQERGAWTDVSADTIELGTVE